MYKAFIILAFIIPVKAFAQFSLQVEVNNLRNNEGKILLQVYDENQNKVKGIYADIDNYKCVITIDSLTKAKYAFKYFHDENNNDELDSNWIGLPIEGYGFSNNAKGTFGPPTFTDWLFELKQNVYMICQPTY